jgi:transcriptional regulator with XRE-family HTH domain
MQEVHRVTHIRHNIVLMSDMYAASNKLKKTKGSVILPAVGHAIERLGKDINVARRTRKILMVDMAQRMGCSRSTLHRLENGDAGISLNTLARALQVLGLLDRISELLDQSHDDIGLMMHRRSLPERISRPRKNVAAPHAAHDTSETFDRDEPE